METQIPEQITDTTTGAKRPRVLVTRPVEQASELINLLYDNGLTGILLPCMQIRYLPLKGKAPELQRYDAVIFTSAHAVKAAQPLLEKPAAARPECLLAIGPATAKSLRMLGINLTEEPVHPYNSESLLKLESLKNQNLQNVAIIKGIGGRDLLQNRLKEDGCNVDVYDVYERILPDIKDEQLQTVFLNSPVDIVTITSNEMLQNLVQLAGKQYHDVLVNLPLVVGSQRAADLAQDLGFRNHVVVASAPGNRCMLDAINIGLDL